MNSSDKGKPSFLFTGMWFGGTATVLQNLRGVVSARDDVECTWLPIEYSPPELLARIPMISLNWTLKGGWIARSRIRRELKAGKKFDAIYFNDHIPATFLNTFRKRVPSVMAMDVTPLLMEEHRAWYGVPTSSHKHLIERIKFLQTCRTYRNTTFLLPWSNWVKRSLIEHYGVDERRIRVLAPGVNLDLWKSSERMPGSKVRILFVGNHFMRKGGDMLCNVARHEPFRNCEFHLVTNSAAGERPPNVVIHSNISPNSPELLHLYKQADVFALPTRADFFPLAIMEAMAMSLPVVATELGSIDEMVTDGTTGFLIRGEDEAALAERLLLLMNNPALRREFGANARRKAEREFNLRRNAEVILETLRKAAESSIPTEH